MSDSEGMAAMGPAQEREVGDSWRDVLAEIILSLAIRVGTPEWCRSIQRTLPKKVTRG